jgi:putative sigma-54 modulation protein
MDFQVSGKNIDITQQLQDYVQKKTERLTRYLPQIDEAKVEIAEGKAKSPDDRFTVQITVRSKGNLLRSEERAANVNLAIDKVVDTLARQISRFKGKFNKKGKGMSVGEQIAEAEETTLNNKEVIPEIVRVKRFFVKSLSVEEAAEQMELLNHDFFLFLNNDTGVINVIYRRKDGNYGLIEPELDLD